MEPVISHQHTKVRFFPQMVNVLLHSIFVNNCLNDSCTLFTKFAPPQVTWPSSWYCELSCSQFHENLSNQCIIVESQETDIYFCSKQSVPQTLFNKRMARYIVIIYSAIMVHIWHASNPQNEAHHSSLYKLQYINFMKRRICWQISGMQDGSKL